MGEFKREQMARSIPSKWFPIPQVEGWVLLSAYQCLLADRSKFDGRVIDLGDATLTLFWGTIQYLDQPRIDYRTNETGMVSFNASEASVRITHEDAWLVVLQKQAENNVKFPIPALEERRSEILALLTATIGITLTYTKPIVNLTTIDNRKYIVGSSPFTIPSEIFIAPVVSPERIDKVKQIDQTIRNRSEHEQRRLKLALHWFNVGTRLQGVDAFINLWIALETLTLQGTANIHSLKVIMASVYGIDKNTASYRFGIGRLHGYRSDLMHGQIRKTPSVNLLSYLAALFVDVLYFQLGLTTERRAAQALTGTKFDDADWMNE